MIRRHPKVLFGWVMLAVFGVGLSFLLAGRYVPIRAQTLVASETGRLSLKEPLVITFNFPVNRRTLKPVIHPEVEGSWTWKSIAAGHFAQTATFTPETVWAPDQDYIVTLEAVGPFLAEAPTQQLVLRAKTLPLPTIVAASISDGASDVPTDAQFHLSLDQSLSEDVDFSFQFEPPVALNVQKDPANKRYLVSSAEPLAVGATYKIIAEREVVIRSQSTGVVGARALRERVFERLFTVKTPPSIASILPTGDSVAPTSRQITLTFTAPMDRSSLDGRIALSPPQPGNWQWRDDKTIVFDSPENFTLDTRYTISLAEGVVDKSGDKLAAGAVSFRTAGSLRVISATPNQQSGVGRATSIRLTFDQVPDEASVASHFALSPDTPIQLSRNGQVVSITPTSGWNFNTTYTATLRAGAIGQYGRPSKTETIIRFTSEEKVVLLNIAWDRQDRALSCEAAALKMALAGKGVRVSEDNIMSLIGYDPTSRTNGGWGDPDVAFVGDINGAQNTTGYGVHWGPVAAAANAWRPAKAVTGMSLTDAARELEAGNPIVIWGVMGTSYYDPWVTPAGRKIEAWKGEHARTLIGFRGSVENPTSFIINDPIAGRLNWSTAKLRSNWATFSNSGVVVY
jgi:uncharacterized protein YvpB